MITVIRKHQTATHARLTVLEQGIRIEWGCVKRLVFRVVTMEMMLFSEFPELLAIWDGDAWNVDELNALLSDAEGTALAEAGLLLLTQKDINILESVGLALG